MGAKFQADPKKIRDMIHQSRQDFEQNFEKLISEAKKLSLEQDLQVQENQVIENELL